MYNYQDADTLPPALDETVLECLRELQVEGEPDLLGELIDLFSADTPELIAAMRQAVAAGAPDALRLVAHSAKGSSSNLGATVLADVFKGIEDRGRTGTMAGVPALLAEAEAEYRRVVVALEGERAKVAV